MKKSELLTVGCGGCGNNLLEELFTLDKSRRYTGVYMNTNLNEMVDKKYYDAIRRSFYIPNCNGTGKDIALGEKYMKEEGAKFAEMIENFEGQKAVLLLSSSNGGTGHNAVTLYPRLIKLVCPDKTISLIATFPNIGESAIDFDNAKEFWNKVIKLKQNNLIDNIQFIDNNKALSEKEINEIAMREFNASMQMENGKIDSNDMARYHQSKGYKMYIEISSNDLVDTVDSNGNVENSNRVMRAINKFREKSVYFIPSNEKDEIYCDVLVVDLNVNDFSEEEIKSVIHSSDFIKFNYKNEGVTKLAIGGVEMPMEAIELIQGASRQLEERKKNRVVKNDLLIDTKAKTKVKEDGNKRLTSEYLDSLFENDDIWNW